MFYLAPHPHLEKPRRGSPRMFTIDWVEKYFSRVRPWHVVAIWVPFSLWMTWLAFQRGGESAGGYAIFFPLGVLAWTLVEYGLHRGVFHFEPRADSDFQKDVSWLIHGIHHDYPWDADRLVMPPTAAALIAVLLWWPAKLAFAGHAYAWFAGVVMGYVWYDLTHYYLHHAIPKSAAGKWMRKYHLVHHFKTPHVRYGITTPLWDLVFGTYPKDKYEESADELEARA
jgi:dihydroceramide fatty acyl 2-hydroxylase